MIFFLFVIFVKINQVYFLDIFLFVFILQYLFYQKDRILNIFSKKFLKSLVEVFRYSIVLSQRSIISVFIFLVLLVCCFGGYFTYSFCPCGIVEFTFFYASIA
jgi:hypothetical protein